MIVQIRGFLMNDTLTGRCLGRTMPPEDSRSVPRQGTVKVK